MKNKALALHAEGGTDRVGLTKTTKAISRQVGSKLQLLKSR